MSEQLDKVKLVKNPKGWWERMDPLENMGVSTFTLIRDAIKEGRKELAKDLLDYLFIPEAKLVHDAIYEQLWGWPSFIQKNYGEDEVYYAYYYYAFRKGWARAWFTEKQTVQKSTETIEQRAVWGYPYRTWSGHRMGKRDGLDGFTIEEYEDRWVVVWDPCSSGGRMRRGDTTTGSPSKLGEPFNLGVSQVPHPWCWNKTGVSLYCVHCCMVHEQMEVDRWGYLNLWSTIPPEPPENKCRWVFYKDQDAIPEELYTRIGKVKPTPKTPVVKAKNPNKIIRIMHSDEFVIHPYTKVKKDIDAGNKEEALKGVDAIAKTVNGIHMKRWFAAFEDYIVDKYGYNELYHALRSVEYSTNPPPAPGSPKPTKASIPSAEERARKGANWGRADNSGPTIEGSIRIIDEPERIVMEMHPCGSGGRMRLGGPDPAVPPAMGPPFNLEATTTPLNIAWGKVGVPHYCIRCCVQEEMGAITRTGYLTTVVEWNEDANFCHWYFYKDLDDIPEKYYTRIGAKKPAPQP